MSVNTQLEQLYSKHFDKAKSAKGHMKISSPLLIKIDEEKFGNADKKVMIFGQETYGWHGEFGTKTVESLMDGYDKYLNNNLRGKNKRVFWKAFHYFEEQLKKFYNKEKTYYIWNNIVKISKIGDKGMTNEIRHFERSYFSVILDEIKILNPDIVIFLTGPDRDGDIKYNFSNVSFDAMGYPPIIKDKRRYKTAYKVISDDLPKTTVRLYHPRYFGGYNKVKEIALEILKR